MATTKKVKGKAKRKKTPVSKATRSSTVRKAKTIRKKVAKKPPVRRASPKKAGPTEKIVAELAPRLFHYLVGFAAIVIHPLRGLFGQIKPSLRPNQQTNLIGQVCDTFSRLERSNCKPSVLAFGSHGVDSHSYEDLECSET
jgi:hypothetical protein